MPEISKRALEQRISPLRACVPRVLELREAGKTVIPFHIGSAEFPPPEELAEGGPGYLSAEEREKACDGWRKVLSALRIEKVSKDELFVEVTEGGSEAIRILMLALADPNQRIVSPCPTYANTLEYAEEGEVTVVGSPRELVQDSKVEEGWSWSALDFDQTEALIKRGARAIWLTNPDNPTGIVYTREEIMRTAELCVRHDVWLVLDEVYLAHAYSRNGSNDPWINRISDENGSLMTAHSGLSILDEIPGIADKIVIIGSTSKMLNSCGGRIGFIAMPIREGNAELRIALQKYTAKHMAPALPSVRAFIKFGERDVRNIRAYLEKSRLYHQEANRAAVRELLLHKEIAVAGARGSIYTAPRLPVPARDLINYLLRLGKFEDLELQGETATVSPLGGFYPKDYDDGKNMIRITCVKSPAEMIRGIAIIREAVDQVLSHREKRSRLSVQIDLPRASGGNGSGESQNVLVQTISRGQRNQQSGAGAQLTFL